MSFSRTLFRLVIILVCAFIGAGAGASLQAFRITKKLPGFRSIAKVVTGGKVENANWREIQSDFYGTIIETIESAEMKRRALERIRALNPDLKDADVDIRAVQNKGSAIVNIIATGPDPKYTKVFLNALLDEFIAFRQHIRELSQGKVLQQFLQNVVTQQKSMEDTMAKLEQIRVKVDTTSARSDQERLVTRLNSQRNQRDDLRLKLKTMEENDAARAPLQARLGAIESEVQSIESDLQRLEPDLAELRTLTEKYAADKRAYEKLFERVESMQTVFNTSADYVVIQERASLAFENVEDWQPPIALGVGGGGVLGALIGLGLSLLLVRAPEPPQMPAAI
jgi:uncharacterized protein involved in exopolysaccharide biosynthesis